MLRTTIARSLRINRVSAIAMSARPYSSEGSTGSGFSRPAGEAAGWVDSFLNDDIQIMKGINQWRTNYRMH